MESPGRRRSGGLFALLAAFVLVAVVVAVSSYFIFGSSQDNNPKTTEKNNEPSRKISVSKTANAHPFFNVVGHCARGRGTLFGAGRGFTQEADTSR
jgi:flagellar basal body-associated protein FliL